MVCGERVFEQRGRAVPIEGCPGLVVGPSVGAEGVELAFQTYLVVGTRPLAASKGCDRDAGRFRATVYRAVAFGHEVPVGADNAAAPNDTPNRLHHMLTLSSPARLASLGTG